MDSDYKLRQCIDAHEQDVKSVFVSTETNGFFSASRDLFVRFWTEENRQFKQQQQYRFHKSYISVVHFMEPCKRYRDGVILSAGYDKIIQGYLPNTDELHFSLQAHSNTVTSIASDANGCLISGSMDGTAILWDLDKCVPTQIFKGHNHGIWSVILLTSLPDYFLTASADKDVCLWNIRDNDRVVQKFSEHTDCVRGLMELPQSRRFLSCSNDSSIRMWCLVTKKLVSVFSGGHTDTVYALGRISDDRFASVGEGDRLCVWSIHRNSAPLQSIVIPVQTIWCISVLQNGDLVTGSDDGYIRVFSEHTALQSGVELPQKSSIRQDQLVEDSSILALPIVGIEMLSLPGRTEGELMRVRDEDSYVLYEWSAGQELWIKRRVLSDNAQIAKKTANTHDYEFSIDIIDGEPPLKLKYNRSEDPWFAAKKFLDDHDLSPMFLDQVANFIISNTSQPGAGNQLGAGQPQHNTDVFCDPFTGASRYRITETSPTGPTIGNNDNLFPHRSYLRLDQINAGGLSKKVREICDKQSHNLPDYVLSSIESISELNEDQSLRLCQWVLETIPEWPDDQLFPLVDILRMLSRSFSSNSLFFSDHQIVSKLISRSIHSKSKANLLTIAKLLVNAFLKPVGESAVSMMFQLIIDSLREIFLLSKSDKNIIIAVASWCVNASVYLAPRFDDINRAAVIDFCLEIIPECKSIGCVDAVHRILIALGTLVCRNESFAMRESLTMNMCQQINRLSKSFTEESKWGASVTGCCKQLMELISKLEFITL